MRPDKQRIPKPPGRTARPTAPGDVMPAAPVPTGRRRAALSLLLAGSMLAWSPSWAQTGAPGSQTAPPATPWAAPPPAAPAPAQAQAPAPGGDTGSPPQVTRGIRPGEQGP